MISRSCGRLIARGRVQRPLDVGGADLAVLARDGDHAPAVGSADVPAGHAGDHARDLDARHLLGVADGLLDALDRRVDVDDDALAQAPRRAGPDADDVESADGRPLRDDAADLGRPHVEPRDELPPSRSAHGAPYLAAVLSTTWSRNRRSIDVAVWPEARSCASTPPSRPRRSSQSSLPSRTSTPSSM